jgi:hypothetical protein
MLYQTYPHVVKCNADPVREVVIEQWDFTVSLAEMGQHYELSTHVHSNLDCLRSRAAKHQYYKKFNFFPTIVKYSLFDFYLEN